MLMRVSAPIPWSQVITKTVKEIDDDNCLGLAAQLSFYFLLGLFPALLFFVALIGYVPLEAALSALLAALGAVAPEELVALLREQLAHMSDGSQASVLTLGVVGALWSSSPRWWHLLPRHGGRPAAAGPLRHGRRPTSRAEVRRQSV
jgi:uncharacterized BrkB/YihY/UPF0761 family membrane protein